MTSAPPRSIGVLSTSYPHRGDPSAGSFVREMSLSLRDRGHRVTVVCLGRRGDTPRLDPGVAVIAVKTPSGAPFYDGGAPDRLGLGSAVPPLAPWGLAALAIASLAASAARHLATCDALVSHFVLPSGLIAGALHGRRPHLAVMHGTDAWLLSKAPPSVQRAALSGATALWFSHPGLRDALQVPPERPVMVAPMGWSPSEVTDPVERDPEQLLCVGRMVAVKRFELAIDAVAALRSRGRRVRLVFVGDGPLRASLEARAERECPGAVTFAGTVDANERDRWMLGSAALVHCAGRLPDGRTEGAPAVLVEAMSRSLPVVACDAGGVASVVGDRGVLVPEDTTAADLADAVAALLDDPSRSEALARRALERVGRWRWSTLAGEAESMLGDGPPGGASRSAPGRW